jgi:hypothetical protein
MKKAGLIIIALLAFLFFTNPGQEDFNEYVQKLAVQEFQKETGTKSAVFEGIISTISTVVAKAYVREDYYIFSIYRLGNHKILGIGKQFISLNKPDKNAFLDIPELKELEKETGI